MGNAPQGLGCFCLVICIGVLPACIYMHHKHVVSMEAREGIKSTGLEFMDFKVALWLLRTEPDYSAKRIKCSYPLSHLNMWSQAAVLPREVVKLLGSGVLLEEVGCWKQAQPTSYTGFCFLLTGSNQLPCLHVCSGMMGSVSWPVTTITPYIVSVITVMTKVT